MRILSIVLLFVPFYSYSMVVNRLNGGGTLWNIDFSLKGSGLPQEIIRTYSTLTALTEATGWSGIFGWGWTSPLETVLSLTPDGNVVLRDGSTGNVLLFHPPKKDVAAETRFENKVKKVFFEKRLARNLTEAEASRMAWPDVTQKQINSNPKFLNQLAARYGISAEKPAAGLLVSTEYGYQTVRAEGKGWIREKDSFTQTFDHEGRLIRHTDKLGLDTVLTYTATTPKHLSEASDPSRLRSFKFAFARDRVAEISDNHGQKAKYSYDELGNLIRATDSRSQTYIYKYENKKFPHLLTRMEYPGESEPGKPLVYREAKYDENGLLVSFREKNGTETAFQYGKNTTNPENSFWTKATVKTAKGTVTEEYDEFLIKAREGGSGKYLYRQDTKRGSELVSTIFDECCGKPLQVTKGTQVVSFKYYPNGMLKERVGPDFRVTFEYDSHWWNKPVKVALDSLISFYKYDSRGNPTEARNSAGAKVALTYNKLGQVASMRDAKGRELEFGYNADGRPDIISEKNGASIRLSFDSVGKIEHAEFIANKQEKGRKPAASNKEIVLRVLEMFQAVRDVLRPAGMIALSN